MILKLIAKIRQRITDMTVIQRRLALFIALAVMLGGICLIPILSVKRSNTPLKIAYSSSARINPFCEDDSARGILSLTHISLSNMTRSGNYILKHEQSESFNGNVYKYTSPVDISYSCDESADTTTYTIKLRNDLKTDIGRITSDDLIFTYYVVLDPSYSGSLRAASADIVGLREYRLNNQSVSKLTSEDISAALDSIDDDNELAEAITSELIIPILTRELDDYRDLFSSLGADGFEQSYNASSPAELLTGIFGGNPDLLDTELIPSIARLYGGDYKSFSSAYTGSVLLEEYFRPQAEAIAEKYLLRKSYPSSEGVNTISGIQRIDELTVAITVYGCDDSALDDLLDIYIAPIELYGSSDTYDYSSASFGFTRGDVSSLMKTESDHAAGGAYYFTSRSDGVTYLSSFDGFYRGKPSVRKLQLVDTELAEYTGLSELDIIMSSELLSASDDYSVTEIASKELVYIGINADRVSLYDQESVYSDRLREAFSVLFSYALSACDNDLYFRGNSAPVNTAYHSSSSQESDRTDAARKIKQLLSDAGFVYDDQIEKFTVAAGGGRLEYELLLTKSYQNDSYIDAALSEARDILSELGLTLTISRSVSSRAFAASIMANRHDFWIGAIDTTYISEYFDVLSSDEFVKYNIYGKNPFNYSSDKLSFSEADHAPDLSQFFSAIDTSHILIPIGQKKTYLYINNKTVSASRFPKKLTQYYSYVNAIDDIMMKK